MTDKADQYERLEKDVTAVKNDISALTDQITDVINSLAGTARSRRAAATSRPAQCRSTPWTNLRPWQRDDGCRPGRSHSIEETLEDAITQRPLAAVGLAIGLGFLIGVTWRR